MKYIIDQKNAHQSMIELKAPILRFGNLIFYMSFGALIELILNKIPLKKTLSITIDEKKLFINLTPNDFFNEQYLNKMSYTIKNNSIDELNILFKKSYAETSEIHDFYYLCKTFKKYNFQLIYSKDEINFILLPAPLDF